MANSRLISAAFLNVLYKQRPYRKRQLGSIVISTILDHMPPYLNF